MESDQPDDSTLVLVGWIPKSLHAPHVVWLDRTSKFWARGANGKYQLDVQELRSAFVASETTRWRQLGTSGPQHEELLKVPS